MCVRMRVPETFVSNRVLLSDILPYSSRRRIGGSSRSCTVCLIYSFEKPNLIVRINKTEDKNKIPIPLPRKNIPRFVEEKEISRVSAGRFGSRFDF